MSENHLDTVVPAKDVTASVSDNLAVLSNAANSADGIKTLQAVRAGAADTAQTHLPSLDISYEHETANGVDLQTWKDSSNRVIASEAKDPNGTDTINTWTYTGNTDHVAASSTRTTDSQGHTSSNVQNFDKNGNTIYNEDDRANGQRLVHQVTADGTLSQKFDGHGNSSTVIADNDTGRVKSTVDTRADGSSETKLYSATTGKVENDTIRYADGSSMSVKTDDQGDTTTTTYDSQHRLKRLETKDVSGTDKLDAFDYDAKTGIKTAEIHMTTDSQQNFHSYFTKYDATTGQRTDTMALDSRHHTGVHNHYENGKLDYELFTNNKGDSTTKYFDPGSGVMDYQESTHADGSKQQKWYDVDTQQVTTETEEDKNGDGNTTVYDPYNKLALHYKMVNGQATAYLGQSSEGSTGAVQEAGGQSGSDGKGSASGQPGASESGMHSLGVAPAFDTFGPKQK